MQYSYDAQLGVQLVTCGPNASAQDFIDLIRLQRPASGLAASAPLLCDFRRARLLSLEANDVINVARQRRKADLPPNRVCCWVDDDGSFGMLRMYAAHAEIMGLRPQSHFKITYSASEVCAWLIETAEVETHVAQDYVSSLLRQYAS